MRLLVGTSGYQYPPWKGRFYPEKLPAKAMLGYYASQLATVEINGTFHKQPTVAQLQEWPPQVPADFVFALKASQVITHFKRLQGCRAAVNAFAKAARALGPQLGPVLYQVPPNLKADPGLLAAFLAMVPKDQRCAFEFRHASWLDDATFAALEGRGAALCVADTDDLLTPLVRTAPFGYFRLRRLDYDLRALRKWRKQIGAAGFSEDVHVYFKHEDTALGPGFARQFLALAPPASRAQ